MTDITITIPAGKVAEVANYVALARSYTGFLPDEVTPETKAQFMRRMLIDALKAWTVAGKRIETVQSVNETAYRDSLGIT